MSAIVLVKAIAPSSCADDAVARGGKAAQRIGPSARAPSSSAQPGHALARIAPHAAVLGPAVARSWDYAEDARSQNTRRVYRSQWGKFSAWCAARGVEPQLQLGKPVAGEIVAAYLASMADAGKKFSTVAVALAAISEAHRMAGCAAPRESPAVRETLKGIRRRLGTAQKGKDPLYGASLIDAVRKLPTGPKGTRDRALLLLGFAGAFRRSELVALRLEDLQTTAAGFAVMLERSKTDQEGEGRLVPIPCEPDPDVCPVRAVTEWLAVAKITRGPLFRAVDRWGHVSARGLAPSGSAVAIVVKKAVEKAGIFDGDFSGHSLRAGLVTAAARAGRSMRSIKKTTGHRSDGMVERYIRGAELFEDVASSGLLSGSGGDAWRGR